MKKSRLLISFSGGRSSAVMLKYCLNKYSATHDIKILFANTGCEHEETIEFVNAVDKNLAGGSIIWIEAETNPIKGKGCTPRVVNYETAARLSEPFEQAIEKEGLFSPANPGCTTRLKVRPIHKYLRSIGWEAGSYDTAIGIRADEMDRQAGDAKAQRFIYPLIIAGITKEDVNNSLKGMAWDLKIKNDAYGNCVWCWKKSLRKLMTVAKHNPEHFDFPLAMEEKHALTNSDTPRQQFRKHMTTQDLLTMARKGNFDEYEDDKFDQLSFFNNSLDMGGGCGASCEIGADY